MVLQPKLTTSGGENALGKVLIDLVWSHAHPGTNFSDQHLGGWFGARSGISPLKSCGLSWKNGSSKENQGAVTKVGERYGGQNPRAQAELTLLGLHQ